MTTDIALTQQHRRRPWVRWLVGDLPIIIGSAGVLLIGVLVIDEPARVELTVSNPTAYTLDIAVAAADQTGWSPVLTVPRQGEATVTELVDEGARWTFRFRAQGQEGGELILTREQLQRAHWRIDVPEAVEKALTDHGAPRTP